MLKWVRWGESPKDNIVDWFKESVLQAMAGQDAGLLLWAFIKVAVW